MFGSFNYDKYGKKCNLEDFRDLCSVIDSDPQEAEKLLQQYSREYDSVGNKYCSSHLEKFYKKKLKSKHKSRECKKALKKLKKHPPKVSRPIPKASPTNQSPLTISSTSPTSPSETTASPSPTSSSTLPQPVATTTKFPESSDEDDFEEIESLASKMKTDDTPHKKNNSTTQLPQVKKDMPSQQLKQTLQTLASKKKNLLSSDISEAHSNLNRQAVTDVHDVKHHMKSVGNKLGHGVKSYHVENNTYIPKRGVPRGLPFLPQIIMPNLFQVDEYQIPLNINDVLLIGFSVLPYLGWIFDIFMIFRSLLERRWIYAIMMVINWYQWFFWKVVTLGQVNTNFGPLFKLFYLGPYASKIFNVKTVANKFIHFFTDLTGNFPTQVSITG
jgi:hypothetical protein